MWLTEIDSVHPYLEEGDQVRTGELAEHEALSKALGFIPSVGFREGTSQQLDCQGAEDQCSPCRQTTAPEPRKSPSTPSTLTLVSHPSIAAPHTLLPHRRCP